jgi:hypothetical protein
VTSLTNYPSADLEALSTIREDYLHSPIQGLNSAVPVAESRRCREQYYRVDVGSLGDMHHIPVSMLHEYRSLGQRCAQVA